MRYSIYFFAMNAAEFAQTMSQSEGLSDRVQNIIASNGDLDYATKTQLTERVAAFLGDGIPDECDAGWFDVLCFTAEAETEKVDVPGFELFKGSDFLDEVGIWQFFKENLPPFPIPVHPDPPPEVGFLPASELARLVESDFDGQPDPQNSEAAALRDTFKEIAESVAEDGLDLLGVLLCS